MSIRCLIQGSTSHLLPEEVKDLQHRPVDVQMQMKQMPSGWKDLGDSTQRGFTLEIHISESFFIITTGCSVDPNEVF